MIAVQVVMKLVETPSRFLSPAVSRLNLQNALVNSLESVVFEFEHLEAIQL